MAKAELGSLGRDFNHAGGAGIGIQRETALSFYFLASSPTPDNLALGLILAGLSYSLFVLNQGAVFAQLTFVLGRPLMGLEWGLVWGLAPLALMGWELGILARREVASWLSIDALALWQWLILTALLLQGLEPGIASIGLGMATGLMFVNSRNLEQVAAGSDYRRFWLELAGTVFVGWQFWLGIAARSKLAVGRGNYCDKLVDSPPMLKGITE
jgi:hypothetical protein